MPYNAPHGPIQAPEKYVNRFPNIENPLRKIYAGMISSMDDGIGKILTKLKEEKIYDNTIVFFLSDNGAPKKDGQTKMVQTHLLVATKEVIWVRVV